MDNETIINKVKEVKNVLENMGGVESFTSDMRRNRPLGAPMRTNTIEEMNALSNEEYYVAFAIGLIGNNGSKGTIIENCKKYATKKK